MGTLILLIGGSGFVLGLFTSWFYRFSVQTYKNNLEIFDRIKRMSELEKRLPGYFDSDKEESILDFWRELGRMPVENLWKHHRFILISIVIAILFLPSAIAFMIFDVIYWLGY